jgi:hypothetical protein
MTRKEKLHDIAKKFIKEAKENNRTVEDIDFGELLVQELTEDDDWCIEGDNKGRRLYHILHHLLSSDKFAA